MAGISSIRPGTTAVPTTFQPTVEGMSAEAGGGTPSLQMRGDSFTSSIRIATPAIKAGLDHIGGLGGIFGKIGGGSGAGGFMHPSIGGIFGKIGGGAEPAIDAVGRGFGGSVSGALSGVGNAFKNALSTFGAALKSNFLVSALVSGVTNVIDVATGAATPQRAMATFVADTAAYTGIGAASTTIGALLGSLIPIPFVGTALGIAVGMGLGFVYEKTVRQGLVHNTGRALFKQDV